MANRFCRNCGHELAENDRFCPNCGKPVHETAHVPTPEADVPVPPPSQQAAGDSKPRITIGQFLVGVFAVIVLVWLLTPSGGDGGGGGGGAADGNAQEETPKTRASQREEPNLAGGGGDAQKETPEARAPQPEEPKLTVEVTGDPIQVELGISTCVKDFSKIVTPPYGVTVPYCDDRYELVDVDAMTNKTGAIKVTLKDETGAVVRTTRVEGKWGDFGSVDWEPRP